MNRRRRLAAIFVTGLSLAAVGTAAERSGLHHQEHPESSPILAAYDFEAPSPSGPDTFWIRQRRGGEVALSTAFRVSGERSLHISEVPGNRDFAEFLAYFRERHEGAVFVQFYLLLTDPEQRFNFGLAGPGWFLNEERHGQAVWLQTYDGVFRHRPHSGWQTLFAPQPFAWYFVDLVYHVDHGAYDLAIYEEGFDAPVIDLRGERNLNGHPESTVKFFSLIGDLEDAGRFDFFVDDLLIATDPEVILRPFVAPGRRRWFVESLAIGSRTPPSGQALEDLAWQARHRLDEVSVESGTEALDQLEEAADRLFLADMSAFAGEIYERLSDDEPHRLRMLLKLSDVLHQRGDVAGERRLRESIYGRLGYEAGSEP